MTSTQSVNNLFEAVQLGNLSLATKVVMAPMTRQFSPEGVPTEDVAAYYRRRAENNVGLIVTEGTIVNHPDASNQENIPHIYGEKALNGWANVVKEVHAAGGKIIPQIWHMGAVGHVNDYTTEDIKEIVAAFADSAASAKEIGFDGLELHGAHGYLIDQFLWAETNARTDEYGGSISKRTRFAVEVIEAVREKVGPDFPIVMRLSQWKSSDYNAKLATSSEELSEVLTPLVNAGVDIFHASTRRFWEPEFEGSHLNFAGWTKKITNKPTITVGSVGLNSEFTARKGSEPTDLGALLERLDQHEFDAVAVGRALLNDPEWATKVKEGRNEELIPFSPETLKTLY